MSTPKFTTGRGNDMAELRQDVKRLAEQMGIGAGARLMLGETVAVTETTIAHGLRDSEGAPTAVFIMPLANASVWQTRAPDETFLYLQASGAVTVNILVV